MYECVQALGPCVKVPLLCDSASCPLCMQLKSKLQLEEVQKVPSTPVDNVSCDPWMSNLSKHSKVKPIQLYAEDLLYNISSVKEDIKWQ